MRNGTLSLVSAVAAGAVAFLGSCSEPVATNLWEATDRGGEASPHQDSGDRAARGTPHPPSCPTGTGGTLDSIRFQIYEIEPDTVAGDPDRFRSWVAGIGDVDLREIAAGHIGRILLEQDFAAAMEWGRENAADPAFSEVNELVATALARRDPASSLRWIQGLPEGANHASLVRSTLEVWAQEDPSGAGGAVVGLPASGLGAAAREGVEQARMEAGQE